MVVVVVPPMSSAFEAASVTAWSASAPRPHGRDAKNKAEKLTTSSAPRPHGRD